MFHAQGPLGRVMAGAMLAIPLVFSAGAAGAFDRPAGMALEAATPPGDTMGGLPEAVAPETLNEQRARQGVSHHLQIGQIESQLDLSDNQVIGGHSGSNYVGQGAFGHARGVTTLIQNTGHNVGIQESTVINISINH